jgi:hypothetical protein
MRKLFFIITFCFLSVHGFGQYTFSGSASGSITIGTVLNMSFINNTGTVSFSGVSQYQSGQTISNCASVAVKSNIPWLISFASNATTFTATGGGASANMPASVLSLRVSGNSFISASTTSHTLATGNAGNTTVSGNSFNLDMNLNPSFGYNGGSYSLGIVYTLTNQ